VTPGRQSWTTPLSESWWSERPKMNDTSSSFGQRGQRCTTK
jgi:hypothetical protein